MLTIPYHLLFPAIIAFCCIGAYSVNNNVFDVYAMAAVRPGRLRADQARLRAGAPAAGLRARPDARGEPAPRHDHLSRGDATVFVTHPLSLACCWSPPPCWSSSSCPTSAPSARKRSRSRRPAPKQRRNGGEHDDQGSAGPSRRDAGERRRACEAALTLAAALRRACHRALSGRRAVPARDGRAPPAGRPAARASGARRGRGRGGARGGRGPRPSGAGSTLDACCETAARSTGCRSSWRAIARNADLTVVGQADLAAHGVDDTALVEAAFMDTGRPALVVPARGRGRAAAAARPGRLGRLARGGAGRAATPCRCCVWPRRS